MASRAADEERAQCAASPPASPTPSTASTSRTSLLDSERHQRRDDNYDDGGDDDDGTRSDSSSRPRVAWLSSHHQTLEAQLYTSHLLSTANSRLFEFGAVLFLAALYPRTLLPMSIYALARSAAAILLAHPVGACIDRRGRLAVVRASIVAQRVAVAASCGVLWAMHAALKGGAVTAAAVGEGGAYRMKLRLTGRSVDALFAVLCVLACVEKLAAMANLVAVERDWVVVMTEGDENWRRGEYEPDPAVMRALQQRLETIVLTPGSCSRQRPHAPHRPLLQAPRTPVHLSRHSRVHADCDMDRPRHERRFRAR